VNSPTPKRTNLSANPGWLQRCVRLLLKSKTSKSRAEQILDAIQDEYPAKLSGKTGNLEIRMLVPESDTKHIWLMLLLKDVKDIKSVKQPNGQKLSHRRTDAWQTQRFPTNRVAGRRLAPALC
jgi:hypothetical protein